MIQRLIVIRHGETVDNLRGVAQGWHDSELSPRGKAQVERIAERIRPLAPDALYCSTLPRAITTAGVIGRSLGLEAVQLEDLREMNCGDWEGLSFIEVRQNDPELYRRWSSDPHEPCPGGESYSDVRARIARAVEAIRERTNGQPSTVAVVSHGTAIRLLATHLLGLPLEVARHFAQDNAAVNVFEWRGGRWVLRTWNDVTHCAGMDEE
ncbi:MAG TPA: histidine phosphatase family protein [Thermoanaerobaculia bacterium]|nr:histidine phosphatase family protein [Thermoanaerobaculia bacterium]